MSKDNKEAILSRLIKTASALWGYPDTQDLNSFDPLVVMMFSAIAEELHGLTTEIKKTDSRLVEKLFELVLSQQNFSHSPAYAILRAKPLQARVEISPYYQFVYKLKVSKTIGNETVYETKDLSFTPTTDASLFKIEPRYFFAGNRLYELGVKSKELIAEFEIGPDFDLSRFVIGLQFDNLVDQLDGLSFLFGNSNKVLEEKLIQALVSSKWEINGNRIEFAQGVNPKQEDINNSLQHIIRKENDASYNACNFVNELFRQRFFTVLNNNYLLKDLRDKSAVKPLKDFFPENVMKSIPPEIIWLEIKLSQPLPQNLLNDITVSLNCFPVINRDLKEFSHSLTKGVNVVPLLTQDLFFDIDRVADSQGNLFRALGNNGGDVSEEGYLVRQGGIARFDSRNAVEMIQNLIDLIRDERSGFSVLGADMISAELKQLDQIINRLQNRIDGASQGQEAGSYLLLRSNAENDRAKVRFWITNGEQANNIRADSPLSLYRGSEIANNSIAFVSNTQGGRQKITGEQKMYKLRRSLLSRGRVVTPEDIKALCIEEFGQNLMRVEVLKGKIIDPDPAKGFMRSIDIKLFFKKNIKLTAEEQNQKAEALKIKLLQESVNILPYRVLICP